VTNIVFLPATDRIPRPWLNGGGVTYDVTSSPDGAGPDAFDWRLSIAQVVEAGPFSLFAGVDRQLAVLEGRLELDFQDQSVTRSLSPSDDPIAFAGNEMVFGRPVGGPVLNLNLMFRRDRFSGHLRPTPGPDFRTTAPSTILLARCPSVLRIDGVQYPMATLDAVSIAPGTHVQATSAQIVIAEIAPAVHI
jgi:environmental stress-induced protein Ves